MAMREIHCYTSEKHPEALSVLGESVTVFGAGDLSKPFEMHLQKGNKGGGPPPHHHPWDEAFYVLKGEVALTVNDETHTLSAGGFVHIPGGTVHAYENLTDDAELLAAVSDPRGGLNFQDIDEAVQSLPEDLPKVIEIGEKYGVVFLKP